MAAIVHKSGITYPDAPAAFELSWEDRGIVKTSRGARRLHRAPATPAFVEAWGAVGTHLRSHGFSVERDLTPTGEPTTVLHWGDGSVVDMAALAEAARIGAEISEALRIFTERRNAHVAERTAEVHARLRETQAAIGWAWSPAAMLKVRDLLAKDFLVEWQWADAEQLIGRARTAVTAAKAKVSAAAAEAEEADLVAVEDPEVRAAVLVAVKSITAQDDDLATEANGVGWSPATTRPGHVLAAEEVLDAPRAVVGLRLLRRHPAQVPAHLRPILGIAA